MRKAPRSPIVCAFEDVPRRIRAGAARKLRCPPRRAATSFAAAQTRTPRCRPGIPRGHATESKNLSWRSSRCLQKSIGRGHHVFDGNSQHCRGIIRSPLVADLIRPRLVHDHCAGHKRAVARRIGGTVQTDNRRAERRRQVQRTRIRRHHDIAHAPEVPSIPQSSSQ